MTQNNRVYFIAELGHKARLLLPEMRLVYHSPNSNCKRMNSKSLYRTTADFAIIGRCLAVLAEK